MSEKGKKKGRKECFCLIFSSFLFLHVDKDDAMNDAKSPKMMVKKEFFWSCLVVSERKRNETQNMEPSNNEKE